MDEHRDSDVEVLLAEDDTAVRETFALWLDGRDGWSVREARTGSEALELLDEGVDVLVLDRRMPRLSGPEVVERLDDTRFDGAVVVLSAYEQDEHLDADDVTAYLTKPVDRAAFLARLERCLDGTDGEG